MKLDDAANNDISELFNICANDLYRYAYYVLGDSQDAKDAVQDTFVRVVRAWNGFRYDSQAKTWLWSIAKNCVVDIIRRRKKHKEKWISDGEHESLTAREPNVTSLELMDLIQKLPINQRQVVVMRLVQEFSTSETAIALGWTESRVRSTLHRAVVRLRSEFSN